MNPTVYFAPGFLRHMHSPLGWKVLVLLGLGLIFAFAGNRPVVAATGAKVPSATLDTANGPYVLGEPPGRVEVLFFSFPG